MAIRSTKPTAATFFSSSSTTNKTKIQSLIDAIHADASRDTVLAALSGMTSGLSAAERDQLTSMVYSQLAHR